MPPNQFRDDECRAGTGSLIVRACAAVVLAACLVSGLATGTRDAAAAMEEFEADGDLTFGSAAGDADVAGTVVVSPAGGKTVTGGATDFGGLVDAALYVIVTTTNGGSYSCTLPGSITVTSGVNTMTVDTFTTSDPLIGNTPGGSNRVNMLVGATVHLAAGQPAGNYTGTLTMTCAPFSDLNNVTITLLAPISISVGANMDFGTLLPTGIDGTVIVTTAGVRTSVNVDLFGGTPAAASFNVTGVSGQTYIITFTPGTLAGPGAPMAVDTFTHDAGGAPTLTGGSDAFNVGATLHVDANQAAGTYSGTFDVTVNYN